MILLLILEVILSYTFVILVILSYTYVILFLLGLVIHATIIYD
jgi:hypothetical protein